MDDDILLALQNVIDPELGISIVDLGLIYRAAWTSHGIEVALTLTSPACPLEEMLIQKAEKMLHERFPETPKICVDLVWEPPWSLDRISEQGRHQLGWLAAPNTKRNALS